MAAAAAAAAAGSQPYAHFKCCWFTIFEPWSEPAKRVCVVRCRLPRRKMKINKLFVFICAKGSGKSGIITRTTNVFFFGAFTVGKCLMSMCNTAAFTYCNTHTHTPQKPQPQPHVGQVTSICGDLKTKVANRKVEVRFTYCRLIFLCHTTCLICLCVFDGVCALPPMLYIWLSAVATQQTRCCGILCDGSFRL